MRQNLFALLCFVMLGLQCFASQDVNNIYSLTKITLDSSFTEILSKSNDSITALTFTTSIEEYDSFLEPTVVQILQEKGINFLGKLPIKNTVHLRMQIEEFSLKWNVLEAFQDSLEEIGVLRGRLVATFPLLQPFVVQKNSFYKTKVSTLDAKRTMKVLPTMIVSEIPASNTSLVEEILTPVLYLGTAVITLLLLFTVRTQ